MEKRLIYILAIASVMIVMTSAVVAFALPAVLETGASGTSSSGSMSVQWASTARFLDGEGNLVSATGLTASIQTSGGASVTYLAVTFNWNAAGSEIQWNTFLLSARANIVVGAGSGNSKTVGNYLVSSLSSSNKTGQFLVSINLLTYLSKLIQPTLLTDLEPLSFGAIIAISANATDNYGGKRSAPLNLSTDAVGFVWRCPTLILDGGISGGTTGPDLTMSALSFGDAVVAQRLKTVALVLGVALAVVFVICVVVLYRKRKA
jgi:hypothetical protein